MKYFFFTLLALAVLVLGVFGFRGDKFSQPPLWVFPDMDEQDKIKAQTPSSFFDDGMGSRRPVKGTIPRSLEVGVMPLEFGAGRSGYYYDGQLDGTYGNGRPEELGIESEEDMQGFLSRGEEVFNIHCAICHGKSGNGKGVVSNYFAKADPIINIPSLLTETVEKYPDGYIYEVITNGKGNMGYYRHNITVPDRWAVVSYVRALKAAAK